MTSARAQVEQLVRADLPSAAAEVVDVVRRQIPAYAALSAEQQDEVAQIATWAIERALQLWVRDEPLSAADVRRFRGIGAARALDGRPLAGVLRAYRVGAARMTDLVSAAGADVLTARDALALARLWMESIDLLSEAVYAGYARASTRLTDDRTAALADLVVDLVSGRQAARTALADRCRELGVQLPARPLVRVAATIGPEPGELTARVGDLTVTLAPEAGTTHDPGARACRVLAHGVADLPRAHRLAALAVRSAPAHAFGGDRELDEGDAQVLALLHAHRDGDPLSLAPRVLGGAAEQPALLAALDAFLVSGHAAGAGALLGLHPQSVRHRLRRLHRLSARRTGRSWDLFTLQAARS